MNVECESKFCLKDEIMVKKKNDCCIQCRKPMFCTAEDNTIVKENDFWIANNSLTKQKESKNACKICQCVEGKFICYINSCLNSKFPTYAHIYVSLNEKKEINARTIPFFADIIKTMRRDSEVLVVSGS